jgi:tRNA uridine 5-carbamoylmethylation protein Kti12
VKRLVIITVGKTHSGKTTFAKDLEKQLQNSVVIDQDNHAAFINTFYRKMLPTQGPNTLKYAVSQTIVDYAIEMTNCHLILSNSNRSREGRLNLLEQFHKKGFTSILVYFDIPNQILRERIAISERSENIFRVATTFEEVLERQLNEPYSRPLKGEADYIFVVKNSEEVTSVIESIVTIEKRIQKEI